MLAEVAAGPATCCRRSAPPVSTVFFGGGTPTLLPAEHLGLILGEIGAEFGLAADVEVTTEANPESVTPAYLAKLRAAGFTRISLGMQSAVGHVLAVLERQHRPQRAVQAVAEARAAGFDPRQPRPDLRHAGRDRRRLAGLAGGRDRLGADHVSAYALIVEDGTALARKVASGATAAPDDDVLADRYLQAEDALRAGGFSWYEVSNWARTPEARSRHNRLYWAGGELVGGRSGRAQPHRRHPVVERQAPHPLHRAPSTPAAARQPAERPWTSGPGYGAVDAPGTDGRGPGPQRPARAGHSARPAMR